MCGIVGIVSNKSVSASIIGALKKLEYRGYDSAGISTISNGEINEQKCSGRVDNLEKILFQNPSSGDLGIGHVRWATHGVPNDINAHPHTDNSGKITLVHNGIIENYLTLKIKGTIFDAKKRMAKNIFIFVEKTKIILISKFFLQSCRADQGEFFCASGISK